METSYLQQALGVEADQLLYVAIAKATKNPFFVAVLESLSTQITFGMHLSRSLTLQAAPDRQAIVQAEHRAIIDAIRDQSADAASLAMRRHIMGARDRMFVGG